MQVVTGVSVQISSTPWFQYSGADISGKDLIIPLMNYNWVLATEMPIAGQNAIINHVNNGGALLTVEWLIWRAGLPYNSLTQLSNILPVVVTSSYSIRTPLRYIQVVRDSIVSDGIPVDFNFNTENIAGTETNVVSVKTGATVFYDSVPITFPTPTPTPTPQPTPTPTPVPTPPPNDANCNYPCNLWQWYKYNITYRGCGDPCTIICNCPLVLGIFSEITYVKMTGNEYFQTELNTGKVVVVGDVVGGIKTNTGDTYIFGNFTNIPSSTPNFIYPTRIDINTGDIYIQGNLTFTGGLFLNSGNLYVGGNVDIGTNSYLNLYVQGNINISGPCPNIRIYKRPESVITTSGTGSYNPLNVFNLDFRIADYMNLNAQWPGYPNNIGPVFTGYVPPNTYNPLMVEGGIYSSCMDGDSFVVNGVVGRDNNSYAGDSDEFGQKTSVWGPQPGTNYYTDDSSYGMAAVHMGLMSVGQIANIRVTKKGNFNGGYEGVVQNGVTSQSWSFNACAMQLSIA